MKKIKVLKIDKKERENYFSDDIYNCSPIYDGTKWTDISEKDLSKLEQAVWEANSFRKHKYHYFVVQQLSEETLPEIFDTAKDYIDWVSEEKAKEIKRIASDKKDKEKRAIERKKKQLAKLKKELEN